LGQGINKKIIFIIFEIFFGKDNYLLNPDGYYFANRDIVRVK
jgi:hypothetical protein